MTERETLSAWEGARCLYDLLDIDEELKEYVTNYRLNLYDCHEHDTFEVYKTGLRQVFETVRYAKDKEKLKAIMAENQEAYSRIDSDTKTMLEVLANVKIPEACKVLEEGKRRQADICRNAVSDRQCKGTHGSVTVNTLPPSSRLPTVMEPWCSFTISEAIDNPSPKCPLALRDFSAL